MANADTTLLSWIATEVNQALSGVREQIAKFASEPANAALLAACPAHLHQVSGALRMVGLTGATRFCEAIEGSFQGGAPTVPSLGVIDRAVQALKEFVDGMERGQANMPLRLFPVYRELATLQGKTDSSEKDLFFPDISKPGPVHPNARIVPAAELPAYVQAQRALFQRGLLAWLRNQPVGGLKEMRDAVDALHQAAAQLPRPQAIWWVALGLLDALEHEKNPEWIAGAKALGNKIDRQMRAGAETANEALLGEMLYALVKCSAATPHVREIRAHYQLDSLFPEPAKPSGAVAELSPEEMEAVLYDLHSRLDSLKGAWVQYVSGEQKTAARFRELVASFQTKAAQLGNAHLTKLLGAVALVTKHLSDPYPRQNQFMVIEMASAFLLIENVIDHFTSPAPDLEQQSVILGGWLLDSAKGKSTGEPPAGLRGDLVQQIGALQLRAQVAREILANLQHIEQVLDAFARDPAKRDTLEALKPYLRQIHGALVVLRFERAAEVLTLCEQMLAACATPQHALTAQDMDWIAEGLSSLGFYLDPCVHGREPADQAIELFFSRFAKRTAQIDFTLKIDVPMETETEAPKPRTGVDPELLDIFLEEAVEVLQNIEAAAPRCAASPLNEEDLTVIRRGFHTLKGSGRMVGLMDLGEIAWEMEQLLNVWLEQKRPATAALLDLVTNACKQYAGWIAQLREGTLAGEVGAEDLVSMARRLKTEQSRPETMPGPAPAPAETPFMEIYMKEAAGHVAVLHAEFEGWQSAPGSDASHEFMRAAHTLASSSRTAGLPQVAELAGTVEQWIPFARQVSTPEEREVLSAAIGRLRDMADSIARRERPAAAAEELARMESLIARLEANPAPPVDTSQPLKVVHPPEPPVPVEPPAPAEAPAQDGKSKRVMRDDIDEQLLPIFLEEAQELVPMIGGDLRDWKANPSDEKVSGSLRRALHTMKGSARMAGAIRLGELTHIMESRIEAALEANAFPPELFAELEEKMDRMSSDVERMQITPVAQVREEPLALTQFIDTKALPKSEAPAPKATPAAPAAPRVAEPPLPSPAAMLRVNADVLDHLINEAGEVAIARSRVEAELRVIKHAMTDLQDSISRLRTQLREVEVQADSQMQSRLSVLEEKKTDYDPLEFDRYTRLQELTRHMAESLNDVMSIQQGLSKNLGETDAALLQQSRTNRTVQQELMRMRAVQFATLNERLYRIVRQTARELDKKAELHIEGAELELDRSVLERIGAPLEHLLRNALTHGLEVPAQRVAAGKPESGSIKISLRQESNEMALILSDDGAGINIEKLHRKALEKGVVAADQELSEIEQIQLVFASGLSTADAITALAGRGVGMDVVRSEITAIGGRIDIATTRGGGTTFTVYLPLTLAVTQAVLVRTGETVLAISSVMVEQVLRVKADALAMMYEKKDVEFQGNTYPLFSMQQLLAMPASTEVPVYSSVLLLRSGVQRIALHVDELVGNQEIVVKNVGPQLARVPGVAGATVLADGRIVLIMNPVALAQRARITPQAVADFVPIEPEAGAVAPVVMVVDDSLTVRKVTSRLLEREGFQVITAKDGVDALEQMKDMLPAVMLVDIEMPRMDGFELTRNVRGDPRMKAVPIIVISSRTADKHRSQAMSIGVNHFLGKPYPEAELLQHINTYLTTH
jgi:chemosensory pili system protein ChpA (sensor histidine kinase/response regulator)